MRGGSQRGFGPSARTGLGVAVLALSALIAAVACGDDDALNQFGAEDAHQYEFELEVGDHYLALADDSTRAPVALEIAAHSDLTITVRNVGDVEHSLTLYGGPEESDAYASTGPLEPGTAGAITFHFHDPQGAVLRDDLRPSEIVALLRVDESSD